ncbi:MAG: hypothetical protein JXA90_03250 [Planctomycetes bacterium]|nr:hypothetical protein [Planctomycetota bacterium]
MQKTLSEKILALLLRLNGAAALLAIAPLFFPRAWLADIHEGMGLGAFPEGPIVEYMARSLCAFYFLFGVLLWIVAADVRRYRRIVTFAGCASLAFSLLALVVDLRLGMPASWTWMEGPPLGIYSLLVLYLRTRIPADTAAR